MAKADARREEATSPRLELRVPAWARLALTVAAPISVALVTPLVGLPGLDMEALDEMGKRVARSTGHPSSANAYSAFALGVTPYLTASLLVEIVAALVPRLRPLRNGAAGRAKLARATVALTILFALAQAFGVVRALHTLSIGQPIGDIPAFTIMITLTAATVVLGLVADGVSRFGLASGYVVLALGPTLAGARGYAVDPSRLGPLALEAALVGAATFAVLARWPATRIPAGAAETYRAAAPRARAPIDIPAPAAALSALSTVAALVETPRWLALTVPWLPASWRAMPSGSTYRVASLALLIVASAALTFAFYQPRRVAALAKAAGAPGTLGELEIEARAALGRAIVTSTLFAVALFAIGELFRHVTSRHVLTVVPYAAALALDVAAELRARMRMPDLTSVWPDQRPYAIADARAVLEAGGVELFVRGERFRRLNPFDAPFAPLVMMVRAADAARATELLEAALGARAAANAPADDKSSGVARSAPAPRYGSKIAIAATLAIAAAVIGLGGSDEAPPRRPHPPARPEVIRIVAVDDTGDDVFGAWGKAGASDPPGLSIQVEYVPIGPGKSKPSHFARWIGAPNETMAQKRAAFRAWAARAVELPPGEEVLPEDVLDFHETRGFFESVGVRSYIVRTTPILDGADVADAQLVIAPHAESDPERWTVNLTLTPAGGEKFRVFTRDHVQDRIAIVVDDTVVSAPRIIDEIGGGHVQITMGAGDLDAQLEAARRLVEKLTGGTEPPVR